LFHEKKKFKDSKKNVQTTLSHPRFLPQTSYVLMSIKCMNMTRTKCPIVMEKVFKNSIFEIFGPLIKYDPH
jgi:hypothetical protein